MIEILVTGWPRAMSALYDLQKAHPGATHVHENRFTGEFCGYRCTLPDGGEVRIKIVSPIQSSMIWKGEKTGGKPR